MYELTLIKLECKYKYQHLYQEFPRILSALVFCFSFHGGPSFFRQSGSLTVTSSMIVYLMQQETREDRNANSLELDSCQLQLVRMI